MIDLNDYALFAEIVSHGGFAAAGRALGVPKSKLSRRLAGLEARLGTRLVERSTRRFRVTEVGQTLYERCRTVLLDIEAAEAVAREAQAEPAGRVRMSCPSAFLETVAGIVAPFLVANPKVRLHLLAMEAPMDMIGGRIDLALRVSSTPPAEASLIVRTLARSDRVLVASPGMAATIAASGVGCLARLPIVAVSDGGDHVTWELQGPNGTRELVRVEPRLGCANFQALREAAIAGLGVALLPATFLGEALRDGRLVRVFPDWHASEGTLQLLFTTRHGLPAATRALIDHLGTAVRGR